jgi:hypothetical protein
MSVRMSMTDALLQSLESLVAAKRQRLTITRSPRSREVLKREIQMLRHQIDSLRTVPKT